MPTSIEEAVNNNWEQILPEFRLTESRATNTVALLQERIAGMLYVIIPNGDENGWSIWVKAIA